MRYMFFSFFDEMHGFLVSGCTYPAGRNPGKRFRLEVPDDPAADENIVLVALARINIQLRHTRPEVSSFTAQAEVPEDPHIESHTTLHCAGGGSGFTRVWLSRKLQRRTFTEVAQSGAITYPRRNCLIGKDVQPECRSQEER
jgi:hypothetical protein